MSRPRLTTQMYLSVEAAAELAGFSIRHFRRITKDDHIPILNFGNGGNSRFMILGAKYNEWAQTTKRGHADKELVHA